MRVSTIFAAVLPALLVTCIGLTGCALKSSFELIPANEINEEEKLAAERVAFRTLSGWRDDRFGPLGDDFTQQMKDALDARTQRSAQAGIADFGAFEGLTFAEARRTSLEGGLIVYRFRGSFSGTDKQPEIRVVMNLRGKASGFWIKPWKNRM